MNSLSNYLFLVSYKYAYFSKTEFIQTPVIHITSCLDTLRKNSRLFLFSKLINYVMSYSSVLKFCSPAKSVDCLFLYMRFCQPYWALPSANEVQRQRKSSVFSENWMRSAKHCYTTLAPSPSKGSYIYYKMQFFIVFDPPPP